MGLPPQYLLAGVTSGRMSCATPNLSSLPRRHVPKPVEVDYEAMDMICEKAGIVPAMYDVYALNRFRDFVFG